MTYPTTNTAITTIVDGASYPKATDVNPAFADLDGVKTMLGVNGGSWIGEGQMMNGKLSVTVSANDLIVALKTIAGTDPSASDPVYIRINGTVRKCTAALSKTLADGTNWFASGSAELGTKEVDYFVYAIWNTTPATDILDLGFARVPYFNVYSDASATTTNEKYLAYANASAPASTDDMVNIGRFAATLSLTGTGHLWTVPTYTTANLVNRPIFETRVLSWIPIFTNVTQTSGTLAVRYQIKGNQLWRTLEFTLGASSAIVDPTYTLPFAMFSYGFTSANGISRFYNGATSYAGLSYASGSTVLLAAQNASATYTTISLVSATVPFTWANTHTLSDSGVYFIG